jgi:hypothetical protein
MNDEDLDHNLIVPEFTPATDRMAHVMRWVGLIVGVGLCAAAIVATLS